MATLLMRTPELASAEKLSMASIEHTRLQTEKVLSHADHEGQHKAIVDGRSRARKGKNGQKKQPQRGLGVAQLEKLRLQEQSKQEAACLASLQSLPSFSFTEQNGGICFRQVKGSISHHASNGSAVSFGNSRLGPPDKLSDYLSDECHHLASGTRESEVLRTIMSLASNDQLNSSSVARHGQGPPLSIMLPRHKDDSEASFSCSPMHSVTSASETPGSKGQGSCGNTPSSEETPEKVASCALACLGSPAKFTSKASFFSNVLASRNNVLESQASSLKEEEKRGGDVERPQESAYMFPVSSCVSEAGVVNPKLLPLAKDGGGAVFTLANLQCFESTLGPVSMRHLPRDCIDIPVVGVAANSDRPKELSSFQSFPSNQAWSSIEKTCGRKRPWYALKESSNRLVHSKSLDLNAPAGENDTAHKECCSAGVAQAQGGPVGAHYTTGIIRSALGNSLPVVNVKAFATFPENETLMLGARPSVGRFTDESLSTGCCMPQSKVKEKCPIVWPHSALTLNRRRCLSSPEVPAFTGLKRKKSCDFLTLGLSSCSYSVSPLESEVSSQDTTNTDEVRRVKRVVIHSEGDDDNLQLQMCNPQLQELASADDGGSLSTLFVDNRSFYSVGSEVPGYSRLSCWFPSMSSSTVSESCPKRMGKLKEEDSLDLQLKLAL